jgi:hypothetical protein
MPSLPELLSIHLSGFLNFKIRKMGKQISYSEVKLFNCQQKMEVNLMSVIQPFDKQFYLFSLRALANEKNL